MISAEKDETALTNVKTRTLLILLLYCISGSLLTLVNKLAIVAFPFPNMLLVLQNGVTVILLIMSFVHASTVIPPLSIAILKVWIPVVLLFVTMLISSLFALVYVSVPTVIVIRNLSTLSVAVPGILSLEHCHRLPVGGHTVWYALWCSVLCHT